MLISKLPFIWYDNINYQNRYKEYCEICDYKLITPPTNMLPFQIRTLAAFVEGYPSVQPEWNIYCSDGSLYAELDTTNLIINVVDGFFYITYSGDTLLELGTLNPITLPCGSYYSFIRETFIETEYFFYSENFKVIDFVETFSTQLPVLFLPFRWYNDILLQNRYKEYCGADCGFCLITPNINMLPFQIRTGESVGTITLPVWKIYCSDGTLLTRLAITNLLLSIIDGVYYFIYNGDALVEFGTVNEITIPCGEYYSTIDVTINGSAYNFASEIFCVKDDIDFYGNDFLQTDDGVNLTTDGGIQLTID